MYFIYCIHSFIYSIHQRRIWSGLILSHLTLRLPCPTYFIKSQDHVRTCVRIMKCNAMRCDAVLALSYEYSLNSGIHSISFPLLLSFPFLSSPLLSFPFPFFFFFKKKKKKKTKNKKKTKKKTTTTIKRKKRKREKVVVLLHVLEFMRVEWDGTK